MLRTVFFAFICCFAALAGTVSTSCGPPVTGANVSISCSAVFPPVPTVTSYADATLSTSVSDTTASVEAGATAPVGSSSFAAVSFTIDENWLILGGTGPAELEYVDSELFRSGLPPFLEMGAGGDDGFITVSGLNIVDGNVSGVQSTPVPFTFGVPFSFAVQVDLTADGSYPDGGYASITYETGTQTYTIPNAYTVNACNVCPNQNSQWEIYQPGSTFEDATLIRTASDPDMPEPSFAAPLALALLAFALRRGVRQPF